MKYRKKQVVIDAFHIKTEKDWNELSKNIELGVLVGHPYPQWIITNIFENVIIRKYDDEKALLSIVIRTLEGDHLVKVGDWIIKGVKNELYPCKPDIFKMTYEAVEDKSPE